MRPGTAPGGGARRGGPGGDMEASMLALIDTLQMNEQRRPKSSVAKVRKVKRGKSGKDSAKRSSVIRLDQEKSVAGSSFLGNAGANLGTEEEATRPSTTKARKRREKRQAKRERDFANMLLINPQQLAIMMGAMGGASAAARKASRGKDGAGKADGSGPGANGGSSGPNAKAGSGSATDGKGAGANASGAETPKDLSEKQAYVDKLASKADLLEIKLIKQNRAIETVRQQMVEEKRRRREMGGVKAYRMIQNQKAKQQQILENRLNKLNIRASEIEAKNNLIVRAINARRLERQTFERSYRKLKRAFKTKQCEMAVMLEQSNQAYEGRQEALSKLEDATSRAQEEEDNFAKEYAELGSVVQEQAQIKSYVQQTAIKRKEKQLAERIAAGNLDAEEEAMLKSKLSTLSRELKKQAESITVSNESIQTYEEAFEKLYASAGVRDMNAIVDQFVRNEDSNFALYNHVQHLTREIERDEEQLRRINTEMEKYKKELSQNEGHRERIVADLEQRLERYRAQIVSLGEQITDNEQSLEAICQATENLFFRIGCPEMRGLENFRAPEIVGLPMETTTALIPRDASNLQAARLSMASPTRSKSIARKVGSSTATSTASAPSGTGASPSLGVSSVSRAASFANTGNEVIVAPRGSQGYHGARHDVHSHTVDSDTSLMLRLGNKVNEANIMLYLGTIEQRTTEIMQLYRKFCIKAQPTFKGAERLSISGVVVPALPRGAIKLDVQAPSCQRKRGRQDRAYVGEVGSRSILDRQIGGLHGGGRSADDDDDDDDDIEDERPLSSEQLREMTVRENLPVDPAF